MSLLPNLSTVGWLMIDLAIDLCSQSAICVENICKNINSQLKPIMTCLLCVSEIALGLNQVRMPVYKDFRERTCPGRDTLSPFEDILSIV